MEKRYDTGYIIFKMTVSLGFILVACLSLIKVPFTSNFVFLIIGLALCSTGDLMLALSNELDIKLREPYFTLGVSSFGLAHLVFCFYYLKLAGFPVLLAVIPGIITLLLFRSFIKKGIFQVGDKGASLYVYAVLIGTFLGSGLNLMLREGTAHEYMLLGIGSILFWISDFSLSFRYFKPKTPAWMGVIVLGTYFAATYMIAASLYYVW